MIRSIGKRIELLRIIAQPIRMRILHELLRSPQCVNDIVDFLEISQSKRVPASGPAASGRGVDFLSDGRTKWYYVIDPIIPDIIGVLRRDYYETCLLPRCRSEKKHENSTARWRATSPPHRPPHILNYLQNLIFSCILNSLTDYAHREERMIDLHTHTIFSDGELIPAELVRRAVAAGYKAIALTDHIDQSNIDLVIPRIAKAVNALREMVPIAVMVGAELTHVPPRQIADLAKEARTLGAQIVVVHGETLVEPVLEGTNRAAIEAGIDILAHPG